MRLYQLLLIAILAIRTNCEENDQTENRRSLLRSLLPANFPDKNYFRVLDLYSKYADVGKVPMCGETKCQNHFFGNNFTR